MHFNRIDLNGIFRITDIEGRGPFMQEILRQSIAGRDGSYRIERRIPERPLNVEGRILAKSKEDLRDKINYLNTILYTNDAVPIIFSDEPDVTYYGEYAGDPEWEERFVGGRGTLPFICYDPFKYSREKTVELNDKKIEIDSTEGAQPIFDVKFKESVDSFKITHKETGKYLKVIFDFKRNDELVLDATTRKVEINEKVQMPTLSLDSEWFDLASGDNNFDITDGVANVTLIYRKKWL